MEQPHLLELGAGDPGLGAGLESVRLLEPEGAAGDRDDGVELRVGPMESGAAEDLRSSLDLPEVGGTLAALADEVRTEADGDGDYLVVGIVTATS